MAASRGEWRIANSEWRRERGSRVFPSAIGYRLSAIRYRPYAIMAAFPSPHPQERLHESCQTRAEAKPPRHRFARREGGVGEILRLLDQAVERAGREHAHEGRAHFGREPRA